MNRYEKYKDSGIPWIGEIPQDWEVNMLSRLFNEHKQKNIDLKETNLLSLSYGKIIRKDINTNEGLLPQSFDGYNILSEGDIVFRLTDLQNDKRSLRTGLVKEVGIITSAYVAIRNRTNLDSSYFHYLFHSYDLCKVFYGLGDGVRQGMNFADLKGMPIIIPKLQEQRAIADFLDVKCAEVDELVALQEQMIDELKAYKQSVITEAVTKGLNPDVPLKDSGIEWIGQMPTHWGICMIKNLFKTISGATPKTDYAPFWDGDIIWITPADYKTEDRTISKGRRNITTEGVNSCGTTIVPVESIIFSKRAPIGLVAINKVPLCTNQGCISCIPNKKSYAQFYYFLISVLSAQFELLGSGTTFKEISASSFESFKLIIPPLEEQQQIADYLDQKCAEIDEMTSIKQKKIGQLKEYKKSIIYEYVTGKKQVNIE